MAISVVLAAAAAVVPSRAEACGCHFLACGGGGSPPAPTDRTERWWEVTVVLDDGQPRIADAVLQDGPPVTIRRIAGSYAVDTVGADSVLRRHGFDFPGDGLGLRSSRTVVRVPFDPEARALRVGDSTFTLSPSELSAEAVVVRRLLRRF